MQIESFRARASRIGARAALSVLVPLALAACGGGGGSSSNAAPPPVSPNTLLVYGTAATGAGIAGTVSIEDAAGHVTSLPTTGETGAFSASVSGMTAPFMLKVASADGSTVLYSAIQAPGRANINPLTSLALLRIAAARGLHSPSQLYAAPASFDIWLSTASLGEASAAMLSRLMPAFVARLPGSTSSLAAAPTFDPFATAWTVGSTVDRLLDDYPVVFSTDGSGIVSAVQTEVASGLGIDVGRSDTAASAATKLAITGATEGIVVGGSAVQLGAQARFDSGALQAVAASWQATGLDGIRIESNGKLSAPAVTTATTVTVTATWFDGSTTTTASQPLTVVPALRPTGIDITGATDDATLAAGAGLALAASVHWSDGSTTTPAVAWSFSGDASAVAQLGSDGLLRAGKPASDSPIQVTAAFSQGGVPVSAHLALTVAHFVRRVQSVRLTGLVDGQVLSAGDHADLRLTASWNDGSESTLTPVSVTGGPTPGTTNHIGISWNLTTLSTGVAYVPISADASARAAESDYLQLSYDNGDGSVGQLSVSFWVKPLVDVPVGLEIRGVQSMSELDTASFAVFVDYADGSSALADATLASQDTTLLLPTGVAGTFTAAAYASKPATNLVATLSASRSYTYQDANGQSQTVTLNATQAITIAWRDPVLVALTVPLDHLAVGVATPIAVTGEYVKFGVHSTAPVTDASFSVDSALVTVAGTTLLATSAPATADASWVTLTTTAKDDLGGDVTLRRLVTIDLPVATPKRLLAYPWGPLDPDIQFRAISSDGHVDDYTVARALPNLLGYESPATRRRLRLLSGVTDFAQVRTNPHLFVGAIQETQYVAAVENGQVVLMRHDDLYDATSTVLPVVLPGVVDARQVAFVVRAEDGTHGPTSVRLYVLDQGGTVRQYGLPYSASVALRSADVQFERLLTGTWTQISAGADFIQLLSSGGAAYAEGGYLSSALGDPAGASHWDDTFAVVYGVWCQALCNSYLPMTDVTHVHAGLDRSFVAQSDAIGSWGLIGPSTQEWSERTRPAGPALHVTSLAVDAWIQADGAVYYDNLAFAEDDIGGPGNIAVGSTRTLGVATWLPSATEIVDGRRPAAGEWPYGYEAMILPTMPIIRTTTDTLYYLDGRQIRDPQGNAIVLP